MVCGEDATPERPATRSRLEKNVIPPLGFIFTDSKANISDHHGLQIIMMTTRLNDVLFSVFIPLRCFPVASFTVLLHFAFLSQTRHVHCLTENHLINQFICIEHFSNKTVQSILKPKCAN